MSNDTPPNSNAPTNEKTIIIAKEDKHWAAWILDIFVGIGAFSQVIIGIILIYQLIAYEKSNELTRQSLELNKQNLEMTAKSLDATRDSLKIAQKNLLAETTPSMDIKINQINRDGQSIRVSYEVTNHSNSPALSVVAFCNLWQIKGYMDSSLLNGRVAIMPNQSFDFTSQLVFLKADTAKIFDDIETGNILLTIIITYSDVAGNRSSFSETFCKEGSEFVVEDATSNIPKSELEKMLKNADPSEK